MTVVVQYQDSMESTRSMFTLTAYAKVHDWQWSHLLLDFYLICKVVIWEQFQVLRVSQTRRARFLRAYLNPLCSSRIINAAFNSDWKVWSFLYFLSSPTALLSTLGFEVSGAQVLLQEKTIICQRLKNEMWSGSKYNCCPIQCRNVI